MPASKVYFTDFRCRIGVSQLDKLRKLLEKSEFSQIDFDGKFVAIKLHFGELGNLSFLRANYAKVVADFIKERGGRPFITDCNTLYVGSRKNALEHMDTAYLNGYSPFSTGCHVIIADGLKGSDDIEVPVAGGEYCKTARIGRAVMDADIVISLAHFKGHEEAGFGGALKQLSIGVASSYGKAYIHGAGVPENLWTADHDSFLESMADAASSVVNYFHGNMIFINVMKNMSVDCDCCEIAEDPCMADMGILVSTDPIAIDQACIDLVYGCDDPGKAHFLERVESRNGVHTIEAAAALGFGSREYTLVKVD